MERSDIENLVINREEKASLLANTEASSEQIQKIEKNIIDILTDIDLSTGGQLARIFSNMSFNVSIFATLSHLVPSLGQFTGPIASSFGAITNTITDRHVGYSIDKDLKELGRIAIKAIQGIALSEGVRGIGDLIKSYPTGFLVGMLLSGLVQSAWYNEAGKGSVAQRRLGQLQVLIDEYNKALASLEKLSKPSPFVKTSPITVTFDTGTSSASLISLITENDAAETNGTSDPDAIPKYTKELDDVQLNIVRLLDKMGKLSWQKEAGKTAIGFAANSGAFITLSFLTPGLGIFNGVIASALGSITHMVVDRVTGTDRGTVPRTVIRTLDGIGVSQGTRSLLALVTSGNVTAELVVNAILPPLVQSGWFNDASQRATALSDFAQLKSLLTKHAQISSELGLESPFDELTSEMKLA